MRKWLQGIMCCGIGDVTSAQRGMQRAAYSVLQRVAACFT